MSKDYNDNDNRSTSPSYANYASNISKVKPVVKYDITSKATGDDRSAVTYNTVHSVFSQGGPST